MAWLRCVPLARALLASARVASVFVSSSYVHIVSFYVLCFISLNVSTLIRLRLCPCFIGIYALKLSSAVFHPNTLNSIELFSLASAKQ